MIQRSGDYVIWENQFHSHPRMSHFSMYGEGPADFKCAELDHLLGDIRFDWDSYKAGRIAPCSPVNSETKPKGSGFHRKNA
jgi:hypothetical protein